MTRKIRMTGTLVMSFVLCPGTKEEDYANISRCIINEPHILTVGKGCVKTKGQYVKAAK